MDLKWIVFNCMAPTFAQGVYFSFPLLISGMIIRLLTRITWTRMNRLFVNGITTMMGLWVLWWYYRGGMMFFVILCCIVYGELVYLHRHQGMTIGFTSVMFLVIWSATGLIFPYLMRISVKPEYPDEGNGYEVELLPHLWGNSWLANDPSIIIVFGSLHTVNIPTLVPRRYL